jgi:hypothetical protein
MPLFFTAITMRKLRDGSCDDLEYEGYFSVSAIRTSLGVSLRSLNCDF